MPRIYRVMIDADGKPACGNQRDMLGVREGAPPSGDIPINNGVVGPGTGGMSVNICPYQIPPFVVPRHLRTPEGPFKGAKGKANTRVWAMGTGDFVRSALTENLGLAPDNVPDGVIPEHGCIEPSAQVRIDDFQANLVATVDSWQIDEQKNDNCPICRKQNLY